jgi:hypothetical protein
VMKFKSLAFRPSLRDPPSASFIPNVETLGSIIVRPYRDSGLNAEMNGSYFSGGDAWVFNACFQPAVFWRVFFPARWAGLR